MRIFILILSSFILFSCNKRNIASDLYSKEVSNSEYLFSLKYIKPDSTDVAILKELEIIDTHTRKIKQVINLDTIELPEHRIMVNVTEDVNFDEYNDIMVLNYAGAYNSSSSFWLYNKSTKKFDHYRELDEVNNPIILIENKEICSKWRIGLSEFHFEKYYWKNDSLTLKEKYEEYWTDKGILKITKLTNMGYITNDSIILERIVEKMSCE